jgi:uncharacterized protein (TIGR03382 family)
MSTSEHQDTDVPVVETGAEPGISDDPDELREQIGQTRAELGETVEALAAKADVKAQLQTKVSATKEQLQERTAELKQKVGEVDPDQAREVLTSMPQRVKANPKPALMAAGGLLIAWLMRRRRKR